MILVRILLPIPLLHRVELLRRAIPLRLRNRPLDIRVGRLSQRPAVGAARFVLCAP